MPHPSHTYFCRPTSPTTVGAVWVLGFCVVSMLHASATTARPTGTEAQLTPYPDEPPTLSLNETEWQQLRAGQSLSRLGEAATGGHASSVFLVEASPDAVWNVLKQFERYPDWIDSVQATEVYRR
ncbi:MAG: SRPBCC family protein, partial [Myxococcota bacterium]